MQCVILVGGLGTRLGALTRDCPKPMLPVAGRPFVEWSILNTARFGFDEFLLLAGYRGDIVQENFPGGVFATPGGTVRVDVVIEPEPRGTGGALQVAADRLAPQFLMMNGDTLSAMNLLALTVPGLAPGSGHGRIGVLRLDDAERFGVVTLDGSGRVVEMRERPDGPGPGHISIGAYWLDRQVLGRIAHGRAVSLEREVFPGMAADGALHGCAVQGEFIDIGVPEDYERASRSALLRRPAVFFDRDGVLNHDAGYTHLPEQFRWREGAREAILEANARGAYVFVVTNQAGVARGLYDEQHVRDLHEHMQHELRAIGAHVDDFRFCPFHPDGVRAVYARASGWRKPAPGMILDLIARWPVDIAGSVLIGDKQSDLDAAAAAGLRGAPAGEGPLDARLREIMGWAPR